VPVSARGRQRGSTPTRLLVVAVVLLIAGCSGGSSDRPPATALGDDAITVGSFNFAESELLAEIYSQALEANRYSVRRAFGLGPREFVAPALAKGLVELVPEYAGTAVQFLSLGATAPVADVGVTHDALVSAVAGGGVTALEPSPAQTANAFVVTRQLADRLGLRSLSDVTRVAPELSMGGPPECPSRPSCLVGLESVYGWKVGRFVPLDAGGPVTFQALTEGAIDLALLFTTDPAMDDERFVELADDRRLQPAENVTPLVRTEIVDRWGQNVVDVIDGVSARLTTDGLRNLNGRVDTGTPTRVVAADWLAAGRRR
jgi:osmoprotectant transport system substrate-binding protein